MRDCPECGLTRYPGRTLLGTQQHDHHQWPEDGQIAGELHHPSGAVQRQPPETRSGIFPDDNPLLHPAGPLPRHSGLLERGAPGSGEGTQESDAGSKGSLCDDRAQSSFIFLWRAFRVSGSRAVRCYGCEHQGNLGGHLRLALRRHEHPDCPLPHLRCSQDHQHCEGEEGHPLPGRLGHSRPDFRRHRVRSPRAQRRQCSRIGQGSEGDRRPDGDGSRRKG